MSFFPHTLVEEDVNMRKSVVGWLAAVTGAAILYLGWGALESPVLPPQQARADVAGTGGSLLGFVDKGLPGPLGNVTVPLPPTLSTYVKDTNKAIALGKALFWDMQVGSDGRTACATCHFHAGADVRTKNAV